MFSHVPATLPRLPNEQQSLWRTAKDNDHAHLQPSENSLFLKKRYRLLPVYFERTESPKVFWQQYDLKEQLKLFWLVVAFALWPNSVF